LKGLLAKFKITEGFFWNLLVQFRIWDIHSDIRDIQTISATIPLILKLIHGTNPLSTLLQFDFAHSPKSNLTPQPQKKTDM
jgi:hypothetical protein